MADEPVPSPDPTPHGAVYLLPGDGKTFYANGHVYSLSAQRKVLEDGVPMPDGTFTVLVVFYEGGVYRKDHQHQWWFWCNEEFIPSAAPACLPNPRPPSVDDIMVELGTLTAASLELVASITRLTTLISALQIQLRGQL